MSALLSVMNIIPEGLLLPLFAIGGPALAVVSIIRLVRYQRRRRHWIRCPGEAYDFIAQGRLRYWKLRWTAPDGQQRSALNTIGQASYNQRGPTHHQFPFPVEVRVDPDDPWRVEARKGSDPRVWTFVGQAAIGLFFGFIGGTVLLVQYLVAP